MRLLYSPDLAAGGGLPDQAPNPSTAAPAAPEPVKSAGVVKKTTIKTPREIELEKVVARLEDKVDGLSAWQKEVTDFMANAWLKPAPAAKPSAPAAGAQVKPKAAAQAAALAAGVLDDVSKELGL